MEEQVLTAEQMQELIAMGVDTSKASMCWINDRVSIFLDCNYQSYTEEDKSYLNVIPTFTLQDILGMLPNIKGYYYPDLRQVNKLEWQVMYKPKLGELPWLYKYGITSIEAAFKMLKWCKTHGYI